MTGPMLACSSCGSVYARTQEFCGLDGTRLSKVDVDPLIGRTVGRYVIEATLGAGGMARVYRGRHEHLDQYAAIKVLHGELSADQHLSKRFEREARSLSRIRHENVVQVLDFGRTEAGLLYMIMELVEGQTLSETMRTQGPIPPEEIVRLTAELARGLDAAHECGYVHRDLKPQNIVLDQRSTPPTVKILDFGLVGLVEGEEMDTPLTRAGTFFGTPTYMSPEQAAGEKAEPASDMYALGVVLYEMMTGSPPFSGDVRQLAQQHIQARPPRPTRALGGLDELALELLDKDPNRRPSPARLQMRLERWSVADVSLPPPEFRSLGDEQAVASLGIRLDEELSVEDRLDQAAYEQAALGPTRRGRFMSGLLILGLLGAGGYGLYHLEQRGGWAALRPTPTEPQPEPSLSESEIGALVGKPEPDRPAERRAPPNREERRRNVEGSESTEKPKPPAEPRDPKTIAEKNAPPEDAPSKPSDEPPEEPVKPVAMVVFSAFEDKDERIARMLELRGIPWSELSRVEPKLTQQWASWNLARSDVPRDELDSAFEALQAAAIRLASADEASLTGLLDQARSTFASLPSAFPISKKAAFRERLRRAEVQVEEAETPSAQRAATRTLDSLLRDLRRAAR